MPTPLTPILVAKSKNEIVLYPQMANRHGLIAGATGTGKTVTLRVLAEQFSSLGVPVFMADVKGDLSGIARAGGDHPKVAERVKSLGLEGFQYQGYPVVFWDVFGAKGHPIRATISEMGPLLLSRILNLNETQAGVLNLIFKVADDNGLLLLDLKDLRSMAQFVGDNAETFKVQYGNVSKASVGAIQRNLLALQEQGAESFFGEPALDFDDLMDVLNTSLKNIPKFRDILQNTYQYVMVDEFQDTNAVQNEIVQQIAARHRRIMVVGDDSQSIYAFRGANYENILRFPQVYPDCAVIKIEENYRSNQYILDFTNGIIDHAKIGFKKKLFTNNHNPHIPVLQRVYGQEDEAIVIVDRIMELIEQGIPLNQIAVLNRADWHNRYIQAELSKRGIPYVVVGGFKFSERMHVRDVVAFLRLTYNPADAVSWHRVLKYIGGVGQVTAGSVINTIQGSDDKFAFEAFKTRKFYLELLELGKMLSKASQPEYNLTQKIEIIRDYYTPLLKARETDYLERMKDVEVLIDLSKKYTTLDKFLSDFALDPPSKRVADQSTPLINEGEEEGKDTVSTVHSAKGLEWYAVFIPHALDGMFPSNRATNLEEMEEERRLFYVACSRAKEELYVTFPRNVASYDAFFHLPSRFLVEIEKDKYVWSG